jgi:hypothetical protein
MATLLGVLSAVSAAQALARDRVYRCGQLYTNQPAPDQACEVVTGGRLSVLGPAPAPNGVAQPVPEPASAGKPRVPSAASRSQEALLVLRTERERVQERLRQARQNLAQWQQAHPSAPAEETHRARMSVERAELDLQSLDREISRWEKKQP